MSVRVEPLDGDPAAWSGLIRDYPDLNLMQTAAYGDAKCQTGPWRVERCRIIDDAGHPVGCFQAMLRDLPMGLPGGLAWINRGPMLAAGASDRMVDSLAAIRARYVADQGRYLRLAAPVAAEALTPEMLARAGLRPTSAAGWASARLDLSRPLEDLRKGLAQKWRNGLNKAEKSGLDLRQGTTPDLFDDFLLGHDRLLSAKGFEATVTSDLLRAWRACLERAEQPLPYVLLAARDGVPAAGMLLALHGQSAEYLAGHVDEAGRKISAGQLLMWRAIAHLAETGTATLDLGGLDPDLTPDGIRRFKEGVGGLAYRLANEVEASPGGLLAGWLAGRVRAKVEQARGL